MAVIVTALAGGMAWGAEPADVGATSITGKDDAERPPLQETEPAPVSVDAHAVIDALAGYRFLNVNRDGGRAAPYDYLHSSPVFGGGANYLGPDNKFVLDGRYLNDKDFLGELSFDHKGITRFTLQTESLFHNLDHLQLFPSPFVSGGNTYTPVDVDPGAVYGVRVQQDLARFRYKFAWLPVHLNLQYWRMLREGTSQLRFADQAFEGAQNTFYAASRPIDRQTHEGNFELDAHLGPIDVSYDFRIRQFDEHSAIPRDAFLPRTDPREVMQRNGGLLQHNENPDSRFYAHTIRFHTFLSGGVVGAASYTYGRRENLSHLNDFSGADQAYNIIQNVAGDLSYTPCQIFSAALKYRRQDVERSNPLTLASLSGIVVNPPVDVRPAMSSQKDVISAVLSYRPAASLTFKGEYRGELFSREDSDAWRNLGEISTVAFPSRSVTHTGTFTVLARPVKGLKVKAEYKYSTTDTPAYATGYEEKHEGSFQASYNAPNRWGAIASARINRENSDHLAITAINPQALAVVPPTYPFTRNRKAAAATASLWFVPWSRVTVNGSYTLLRTSIDQAVLLASVLPGLSTLSDYTSQAQVYSIQTVYRHSDRLDLSFALQQVRSYAEFDPQFVASGASDTSGIKEISRLKTVENSVSARADYQLTKNFSCSLEYAYREYDEKYDPLFNGSVNSVMVSMATKW